MARTALRDIHRAQPAGMAPFLVAFDDWRGSGADRRELTLSQAEVAEGNRSKLLKFIESQGLQTEVDAVAPSTLIGAIGVIMTSHAAERIARMDGVTKVIRAT